jgi:L-fucose mutarotase
MLKSIDPILSPDLLATLRAMGHGDTIAIVDANFPAESNARRLIRLDGHGAVRVLDAVLSLLPLDDFEPDAAQRMQVVGDPSAEMPIFADFRALLARHEPQLGQALAALERHAFYAAARAAFAIIATGETQLYGNILLRKGVIKPTVA